MMKGVCQCHDHHNWYIWMDIDTHLFWQLLFYLLLFLFLLLVHWLPAAAASFMMHRKDDKSNFFSVSLTFLARVSLLISSPLPCILQTFCNFFMVIYLVSCLLWWKVSEGDEMQFVYWYEHCSILVQSFRLAFLQHLFVLCLQKSIHKNVTQIQ